MKPLNYPSYHAISLARQSICRWCYLITLLPLLFLVVVSQQAQADDGQPSVYHCHAQHNPEAARQCRQTADKMTGIYQFQGREEPIPIQQETSNGRYCGTSTVVYCNAMAKGQSHQLHILLKDPLAKNNSTSMPFLPTAAPEKADPPDGGVLPPFDPQNSPTHTTVTIDLNQLRAMNPRLIFKHPVATSISPGEGDSQLSLTLIPLNDRAFGIHLLHPDNQQDLGYIQLSRLDADPDTPEALEQSLGALIAAIDYLHAFLQDSNISPEAIPGILNAMDGRNNQIMTFNAGTPHSRGQSYSRNNFRESYGAEGDDMESGDRPPNQPPSQAVATPVSRAASNVNAVVLAVGMESGDPFSVLIGSHAESYRALLPDASREAQQYHRRVLNGQTGMSRLFGPGVRRLSGSPPEVSLYYLAQVERLDWRVLAGEWQRNGLLDEHFDAERHVEAYYPNDDPRTQQLYLFQLLLDHAQDNDRTLDWATHIEYYVNPLLVSAQPGPGHQHPSTRPAQASAPLQDTYVQLLAHFRPTEATIAPVLRSQDIDTEALRQEMGGVSEKQAWEAAFEALRRLQVTSRQGPLLWAAIYPYLIHHVQEDRQIDFTLDFFEKLQERSFPQALDFLAQRIVEMGNDQVESMTDAHKIITKALVSLSQQAPGAEVQRLGQSARQAYRKVYFTHQAELQDDQNLLWGVHKTTTDAISLLQVLESFIDRIMPEAFLYNTSTQEAGDFMGALLLQYLQQYHLINPNLLPFSSFSGPTRVINILRAFEGLGIHLATIKSVLLVALLSDGEGYEAMKQAGADESRVIQTLVASFQTAWEGLRKEPSAANSLGKLLMAWVLVTNRPLPFSLNGPSQAAGVTVTDEPMQIQSVFSRLKLPSQMDIERLRRRIEEAFVKNHVVLTDVCSDQTLVYSLYSKGLLSDSVALSGKPDGSAVIGEVTSLFSFCRDTQSIEETLNVFLEAMHGHSTHYGKKASQFKKIINDQLYPGDPKAHSKPMEKTGDLTKWRDGVSSILKSKYADLIGVLRPSEKKLGDHLFARGQLGIPGMPIDEILSELMKTVKQAKSIVSIRQCMAHLIDILEEMGGPCISVAERLKEDLQKKGLSL